MRSSSARGSRLSALSRPAICVAALALATGCGGDKPEPKKLDRASPFDRGGEPRKPPDPNNPLRNPAYEPPRGRDGEQIPSDQIDAALAEAAEFAAQDNVAQQRNALRKCANKTPASARCDGEMGLSMIANKNRRVAALYYLLAAAQLDDPDAGAELYARVGEALRRHGRFDEAIVALERAVAREPSGEHLFALGQTLSLRPDTLPAAADRMAEARSQDDRLAWLYEEATVRGQTPVREQAERAAELFREYLERVATEPSVKRQVTEASVKARIAELEQVAKRLPTQAEYDAQQAKLAAGEAATPAPGPAEDPGPR